MHNFKISLFLLPLLISCTNTSSITHESDLNQSTLEISGQWFSDFGDSEIINNATWIQEGEGWNIDYIIIDFSNKDNWVVTQNSLSDNYDPLKFNLIVWTEPKSETSFYYCVVDYGLNTEEAARLSTVDYDLDDLHNNGCGGYPWTKLIAQQ